MFENVDNNIHTYIPTDRRQRPIYTYLYYKLTYEPKGSGELKTQGSPESLEFPYLINKFSHYTAHFTYSCVSLTSAPIQWRSIDFEIGAAKSSISWIGTTLVRHAVPCKIIGATMAVLAAPCATLLQYQHLT